MKSRNLSVVKSFRWAKAIQLSIIVLLSLVVLTGAASAAPLVYVITGTQQFGTVDLANGHFTAISNGTPDALSNLFWYKGNLLTVIVSGPNIGSLARINPTTGEEIVIGQTGLGFNIFDLGAVRGQLYVTDLANNIYSVDAATGVATPMTATGMPPDPSIPFTVNSDGTLNLCDEGLYSAGGKLYATFDSFDLDLTTTPPAIAHMQVAPALYQIDPATGLAKFIAKTDSNLTALLMMHDKAYAFKGVIDGFDVNFGFPVAHAQLLSLNLATGATKSLTDIDHSIGIILGAAPVRR